MTRYRASCAAALAAVALVVAACGSSSSSSQTRAPATSAPASSGASASTTPSTSTSSLSIGASTGSAGTYLTGASGRALYLWAADAGGRSSCSGACAKVWPPVTVSGSPTAASGVNASDLGTTTRSDGTKQVTYKRHPVYYFIGDKSAGTTNGQGRHAFGANWWLVAPSGAAITSGGSASSSGSYGSGYSSGY